MLIIPLTIATLLLISWFVLLSRAGDADINQALGAKIYDLQMQHGKQLNKIKHYREITESRNRIIKKCMKLMPGKNPVKKAARTERELERAKNGNCNNINIMILPGYVLEREVAAIGKSNFRKIILSKCLELYDKKYGGYKACQVLASMLSYLIIGTAFSLLFGVICISLGGANLGMGVMTAGTGTVFILVYGTYDELCQEVKRRQKAISRQFPAVISKLALLVTSGMIMDRAWKETAYSQDTELYTEMQKTSKELDNLVSPEVAYSDFINRCNTKETAKLASAILQNQSKGNALIGRLLKEMAHEVWLERRHTAKRDAEKATSKLMIPTMMLFLAILVMLMVPIAMNFSGL